MGLNKCLIKQTIYFVCLFTTLGISSFGQKKRGAVVDVNEKYLRDTTLLKEVVLTGQINKQSINKSVAEVEVISQKQIQGLAANNLADVLNQTLNINVIPDGGSGKSEIKIFGLDGGYFKVLVDNIPLVSEEGFGNNIDLTQIDLNDIERVELVEGASGALYGANAVTGVLNIITKKKNYHKLKVVLGLQEESVGNEYNFEDKGRHVKNLKIAHQITDDWSVSVSGSNNNFKGFFNDRKGSYYIQNDSLRGHDWLPKNQYNSTAILNYNGAVIKSFYKFSYLNEKTLDFNEQVIQTINEENNTITSSAKDQIFRTNRFIHHLNISGKIKNEIDYDVALSYQKQKKEVEKYTFYIVSDTKDEIENLEFESRSVLFSRGTLSNLFKTEKLSTQLGYELTNTEGFAAAETGVFNGENISRTLTSYDGFLAGEYVLNNKIALNGATRLTYSNLFTPQWTVNFNASYKFRNKMTFRLAIGKTPKQPSYDELYTYFVDSNHDFRGNEDLVPEQARSVFTHLKKTFKLNKTSTLNAKISAWYLDVEDKIESTIVNTNPLSYQYNNIDEYRNIGLGFRNKLFLGRNLQLQLNFSLTGSKKVLNSINNYNNDYLFTLSSNSSVVYHLPKYKTTFSVYVKHTGKELQYIEATNEQGDVVQELGEQSAFTWIDTSIKQPIAKNLDVTLGVRNIGNIIAVNTSAQESGAHSATASSVQLGYGRSYFIKLKYQIKMK